MDISNDRLLTLQRCYCAAILLTSLDSQDKPMDSNYRVGDFNPVFYNLCCFELSAFLESTGDMIQPTELESAVYDFWFTRNGDGCGFWDGDWDDRGDTLTELTKKFKHLDVFIDDNNKVNADF